MQCLHWNFESMFKTVFREEDFREKLENDEGLDGFRKES